MIWLGCLCGLFAAAAVILSVKVYLMKKSAREIKEKMSRSLSDDTNLLIDISSGDKDMRALAESLNDRLRELRKERLRYSRGDAELKNAAVNVSHDLRTPLTAIFGYLELLEREENTGNREKYLEQIRGRTEAMKRLSEELFGYSLAASEREMDFEKLCLNDALGESLASYYGAILQRGIKPETDITDRRIERELDRSALSRIFGNIISNALKYSDGDLSVKLTDEGRIVFSNTAKSLDAVTAGRLFDRFYTVENARESTGLGLSIAKLLTERMGGTIKAEYIGDKLFIEIEFKE